MDDSVGKYIVFKFNPTKPDKPSPTKYQGLSGPVKKFADRLEQNRAKEFKNLTTGSGPISVTPVENARFIESETFAQDHKGEQLSAALPLYSMGADPYLILGEVENFGRKVSPDVREGVMGSVYNTLDGLENYAAGDERLSDSLRKINQEPDVTLAYVEAETYTPQSNEVAFSYTPDTGLRQVYDMARPLLDKPIAKLKGKAKKKALKLLNKGSKKLGKKVAKKAAVKVGKKIIKKGVGKTVQTAVTALAAETGPLAPIIGWIVGKVTGILIDKILIPLAKKLKKAAKYIAALGMAVLGAGVLMASPFMIIGGGMMIAGSVMAGGVVAITAGIIAIRAVVPFLFMSFLAGILPALLIALVVTPLIIAFTIFVITTGAYVVPGPAGIIGGVDDTPVIKLPFPGGGGIPGSAFYCGADPNTIVAPGAEVRLLPDTNPARATGLCIEPTIIVIHWSAAWTTVMGTYWTFANGPFSCQFATDNWTKLQMMQLWPDKVEYSRCAGGDYNNYALNIEMTGTCFSPMPICPSDEWMFTLPEYEEELRRTVDLTCWMMQQYNIGVDGIVGHYELWPDRKSDPGKDFLYEMFIPAVEEQCG